MERENEIFGADEKKLVDKFLTIRIEPDSNKQSFHLEKMLQVFRNSDLKKVDNTKELTDEEIELVAAAGIAGAEYESCPYCGRILPISEITKHKIERHQKL